MGEKVEGMGGGKGMETELGLQNEKRSFSFFKKKERKWLCLFKPLKSISVLLFNKTTTSQLVQVQTQHILFKPNAYPYFFYGMGASYQSQYLEYRIQIPTLALPFPLAPEPNGIHLVSHCLEHLCSFPPISLITSNHEVQLHREMSD